MITSVPADPPDCRCVTFIEGQVVRELAAATLADGTAPNRGGRCPVAGARTRVLELLPERLDG